MTIGNRECIEHGKTLNHRIMESFIKLASFTMGSRKEEVRRTLGKKIKY